MIALEGDYLELRTMPESDIPALLKIYQGTPLYFDGLDYDVAQITLDDVHDQWQQAQESDNYYVLGVYHIETDLLIGVADVQLDMPQQGAASLWLLIWGGFQRQGYGQECLSLLQAWIQAAYHITDIYPIAANNKEGQSFLELQGFQPTGESATPPIGQGEAFWMRRTSNE